MQLASSLEFIPFAKEVGFRLTQQRTAFVEAIAVIPRIHQRHNLSCLHDIPLFHHQLLQKPLFAGADVDAAISLQFAAGSDHTRQGAGLGQHGVRGQILVSCAPGCESQQQRSTRQQGEQQAKPKSSVAAEEGSLWGRAIRHGWGGLKRRARLGLQHGPTKVHNSLAACR